MTEEAGENKSCRSRLNHANSRATNLDRLNHTLWPSICLSLQALTILVVSLESKTPMDFNLEISR